MRKETAVALNSGSIPELQPPHPPLPQRVAKSTAILHTSPLCAFTARYGKTIAFQQPVLCLQELRKPMKCQDIHKITGKPNVATLTISLVTYIYPPV